MRNLAPAEPRAAHTFVLRVLEDALERTPALRAFQERLLSSCALRLVDMIDHIAVPFGTREHEVAGWTVEAANVWACEGAPSVVARSERGLALRVERLERLLHSLSLEAPVAGGPNAPLRRARLFTADGVFLDAVERNSAAGFDVAPHRATVLRRAAIHQQIFRTRRRHFRTVEGGLDYTERLVEAAVADIGPEWAGELFLRAEREYWLSRCEAGVLQKRRQDRAGVGWCSIDHLVYCVSREHFHRTTAIFEQLGYERGELACGAAGAGMQVLRRRSGPAVLIDVDLDRNETEIARGPLQPLVWHGRAGLWCALHGESLLDGGPCRLAARYDLAAFEQLISREGGDLASPFADEPDLKQRVTAGELRAVNPVRIDGLERAGHVSRDYAEALRMQGAVATHFQAVQRTGFADRFLVPNYAHDAFGGDMAVSARAVAPGVGRRAPVRLKRRRPMRA